MPEWGQYVMAVGEHIVSVYPGSDDRARYDVYHAASREHTPRVSWSEAEEQEFALYQRVRDLREAGAVAEETLAEIAGEALKQAPGTWLLLLEVLELAPGDSTLAADLRGELHCLAESSAELKLLVERGIKLLDNPPLAA